MTNEPLLTQCLNTIDYPQFNINSNITAADLAQLISRKIYWVVMRDPMADSRWVLLNSMTDQIMEKILAKWSVRANTINQLYEGICLNCNNYSDYLQIGICNICRDFAQNGLDTEPYFLSDNEKAKQLSNIKNDFFPILTDSKDNRSTLPHLQELIAELQYIPASTELDYSHNPGRGQLRDEALWRFGLQSDITLFRLLTKTCSGKWYKTQFGTWFHALIEAKVLRNAQRKTHFGTTSLANDGHVCNSIGEKTIDDWLYLNGIAHTKEPLYPAHPQHNPDCRLRADWKVGDYLLEFCGLSGLEFYDSKMAMKRRLAESCSILLLEINQEDLRDLKRKLGFFESIALADDPQLGLRL